MAEEVGQLFIGGQYRSAESSESFDVINPFTEEKIGTVPESGGADVDAAVAAARAAADAGPWRDTTPTERAEFIRRFVDGLERRGADLAAAVSRQNGSPFTRSQWSNGSLTNTAYRYAADVVEDYAFEEVRPAPDGSQTLVRREPLGVAGLIVPWNAPHALLAFKLAPALATGNTVVIKPAPETSLDIRYLTDAAKEAGIPDGVINVVLGGRDAGEALVRHPGVDKIAFTGSTVAGRAIGKICGEALKPVTLELGGKSAAVVLEDADVDTLVRDVLQMTFGPAGQFCAALTRIVAPRARYDEIVARLADAIAGIRMGDPFDAATTMGPVVADRQRERVERYIAIGLNEGARLVTGGGRPNSLPKGYFVEPTLFADVDNGMTIAQEEIFGPVLSVIPYQGDAEAIDIANASAYGLGGVVYSEDEGRARDVARRVRTGTMGINRYSIAPNAPFGGYKSSGLGRELGPESFGAYLETKSIYL